MQSPDWVTLVTDLTQHGFFDLLFVEIFCPQDGDWRGAVTGLSENILPCPKCEQPAEVAILGRGLTKDPRRSNGNVFHHLCGLATKRIVRMLPLFRSEATPGAGAVPSFTNGLAGNWQKCLRWKREYSRHPAPKARTPRATRAEMQQRIRLIAEMMVRGESQREIAQKVSRNWDDFRVLLCRRRPSIEAEVVRLRASVLHEPFDRERRFVCS